MLASLWRGDDAHNNASKRSSPTLTYSDIIETLRAIVQEKNADELFQNALYHSYTADPKFAQKGVLPVKGDDLQKDADQGMSLIYAPFTS
jgi:hypothetical protein